MPNAKPRFAPLMQALKRIELWLAQNGVAQLMVAAPTPEEFQQQHLPTHTRIILKKRKGPRVAVRGRRHYQEPILTLAHWPQDGLDENALPFLACVVHGAAELNIADYILHCQAGDMIYFPAGIPKQDGSRPHFEGDPTGRHCDILWLSTERTRTDGLRCWLSHSKDDTHISGVDQEICWVEHKLLSQLFIGFCEEMETFRRPHIVLHLLSATSLLLSSEIEAERASSKWGERRYAESGKQLDFMEVVLEYIEDNIDKHLTINGVARQMSISRAAFTRHFRQHTGQSFHEYYTQLRMQRAMEQLTKTDLPVAVICQQVGLKYGQLRALFQKHHGCAPGKFREDKQKQTMQMPS
jgi:AraC-like DNA-binding protein